MLGGVDKTAFFVLFAGTAWAWVVATYFVGCNGSLGALIRLLHH